ncbi:hypothetical protein ACIBBE_45720 [Streptomyces sp. NPDC051644]|uniref:virginiamycin B lyase family protein n=1 Tax=Streptomyces sp. NPDC051644 TaxID=3365666 RepID=UPI0037918BD7
MWFTEYFDDRLGRIVPGTGAVTEYPLPGAGSSPLGIAAGPDGNLWFTENSGNRLGRIVPGTEAVTEYPLPNPGSEPQGITAGPDGSLWFTERSGNRIGKIEAVAPMVFADVAVSLKAPSTVRLKQPYDYTLTVTNKGPDTATDVVVTLDGLKRLRVLDAVPAPEATTRAQLRWQAGSLAAGESRTFTVRVKAWSSDKATVTAEATSGTPDPDPNDNADTTRTRIKWDWHMDRLMKRA